jgi:hypothetical protein
LRYKTSWPCFARPHAATLAISDKTEAVSDFRKDRAAVGLIGWSRKTGLTLMP